MKGGLAQLARAPALHAGGQEFESLILHTREGKRKGEKDRKKEERGNNKQESVGCRFESALFTLRERRMNEIGCYAGRIFCRIS